jgi:hypothetical protein
LFPAPAVRDGQRFPERLNRVVALAASSTRIVPGARSGRRQDGGRRKPRQHRDPPRSGGGADRKGKTHDEVIAAEPLADFDARVPQPGTIFDRFLGQVYVDLKAGKSRRGRRPAQRRVDNSAERR